MFKQPSWSEEEFPYCKAQHWIKICHRWEGGRAIGRARRINPCTPLEKLLGRAKQDQIFINGHPVTALLDTGSQVTHDSQDFCLAKGIQIHPISQLVDIEETEGTVLNMWGIEAKLSLPMDPIHLR